MISVNLLPKEERQEERRLAAPRVRILLPLLVGVLLIIPVGSTYLMQQNKIQSLKNDILVAQQESQRLKPQIARINQLMKKREELNLRLRLVRDLNKDRTRLVRLMDELALEIPENLWLTKFSQVGEGAVQIEGMTFSNLIVADLMFRLEETEAYEDVDLVVAERGMQGSEEVVKFTLTARIAQQ